MPAQVPRGNIYQDSEIGGVRHGPFPVESKGGRRDRAGWINSKKRGISAGQRGTKLSRDGSLRRLNPFQLIPDRRELTAATTIVSSNTSPLEVSAVGCLIIYELWKYRAVVAGNFIEKRSSSQKVF